MTIAGQWDRRAGRIGTSREAEGVGKHVGESVEEKSPNPVIARKS